MKSISRLCLSVCLSIFLASCGGGGGGSTPSQPAVTTYPVQQAIAYAYTHGLQQTLNITGTATNGTTPMPITGSLTLTVSAVSNTTFNNAPAYYSVSTISGSLYLNNQSLPLNITSAEILNTAYVPIGSNSTDSYCIANSTDSFPVAASAGQTGTLTSVSCYSDSSKLMHVGNKFLSYVTMPGSNGNLNIQLISNSKDASGKLISSESDTYSITPNGILTLIQISVMASVSGITMTLNGSI